MSLLARTNRAAALVVVIGLTAPGLAQEPEAAPPRSIRQPETYDGRPIRQLRLLRIDPSKPDAPVPVGGTLEQLIRNQVRTAPGAPFSHITASEDLTRLNRLGRFKTITSEVQLQEDGSVVVTYTLAEQPVIEDVQVVGNTAISDQEILKAVAIISGTPVDRFQIDRNARAIEDVYKTKGYYRCRVSVDEKELADSSIVLYRIIEGDRVRVASVRFEGNTAFSARELRPSIRTTEFFPIFEKGPLDDDVLTTDAATLMKYYRDHGYLDAKTSWRVQPSPDGREAIVTFLVDQGPLYNLRSVRVFYTTPDAVNKYRREVLKNERSDLQYLTPDQMRQIGERPFSDEQVAGLMAIKPGDVYSEDKLRKSQQALEAAYGKLGYILDTDRGPVPVRVNIREVRDEKRPQVDLLLFVTEGKPVITGEVTVVGNDITKHQVILRQIQVRPERPLDSEALDESRRRLDALRLFAAGSVKLAIKPEDPNQPGVRDVVVEVDETNTGEFNFGAAIGSDAGVVGRFAVVQRNFDIADVPDSFDELLSGRGFRGAGQAFDLEILPGNRFQEYKVTLSEPYLFESDYSASGTLFFRNRDYREYDERRYGTRVGLGRRFGSVWEGQLAARVESVDLSDIEPDKPVDVFAAQDEHLVTGLGFELVRNTTDNRFRPGRGTRVSLGAEQIGALGGDFDFTKLSTEFTGFFTLNESFLGYKTVLKLSNNMSYIPQSQGDVPVFERLYQGGQNFRGFGSRAVSPIGIRNDTGTLGDDPVGGTWSFFLGAEVNQPIYKDIVSVVGFVDTGTVQKGFGFDEYRVSVGLGLRLYIQGLSPVPLAFDFGFPIIRQDTDRRRLFTFSIDVPFQ